jgi:hypothetical protein
MFESNFPVDKGSCGCAPLWNAFKRIASSYSATEKAALFAETATKLQAELGLVLGVAPQDWGRVFRRPLLAFTNTFKDVPL